MDLHSFRQLISTSVPEDWEVVAQGPTYLPWLGEVSNASAHWIEIEEPHYLAVMRNDVDVRLAWGAHLDDDLSFEGWDWPNAKISRVAVDGFFRGSLVWRWTAYLVDGGRCYLPETAYATVRTGEQLSDLHVVGYTSSPEDVRIARLIDGLPAGSPSDFDTYFQQSKIVELPN